MNSFESFEKAKFKRFVNTKGKPFKVLRSRLNAYKEPKNESGEYDEVATIKAVYHQAANGYLSKTNSNGGSYTKQVNPMLLCMKDEGSNAIRIDDFVYVADKKYYVVKKDDVNNLGIAYDISLEYKDDGSTS